MRYHKKLFFYLLLTLSAMPFFNNCSGMTAFQVQSLSSTLGSPTDPTTRGPTATPQPISRKFSGSTLSPDEKIQNGDFESGKTGWGDYGNTEIVSGVGHNGTSALHLLGSGAGGVVQTIQAEPGKTYRVSCFSKSSLGNNGIVVRTAFSVPGQPDVSYLVNPYSADWQRLAYDVLVPTGASSFQITIWNNGGGDGGYFDDFSVREIISLVVPQALLDDGDSISAAPHAAYYASGESDLYFYNQAVGGSGLGSPSDTTQNTLYARLPAMLSQIQAHPGAVVTILIGANDLGGASSPEEYASRLFEYCDKVRAAGAKVALGTVLPRALPTGATYDAKHNQYRAVLNPMIRAAVGTHVDAVIDYAADPLIGLDNSPTNLTYYSDGLHPTWGAGGGQEIMSRIYRAAVNPLFGRLD